jgi:hypothetical protein
MHFSSVPIRKPDGTTDTYLPSTNSAQVPQIKIASLFSSLRILQSIRNVLIKTVQPHLKGLLPMPWLGVKIDWMRSRQSSAVENHSRF